MPQILVKPNFLVIGAQKAGTTALYTYLDQHPDIFMSSIKELRYFSREFPSEGAAALGAKEIPSFEAYCSHFSEAQAPTAIGEVSPSYMFYPGTAERIRAALPEVRLIATLRDPVDRAYSEYWHHWRMGRRLGQSFIQFCRSEPLHEAPSVADYQDCLRRGLYFRQLEPFFSLFPKDQLKIIECTDLLKNPENTLWDLFSFLEVKQLRYTEKPLTRNERRVPRRGVRSELAEMRCKLLEFFPMAEERRTWKRMKVRAAVPEQEMPQVSDTERRELQTYFLQDIRNLEKLLDRDFSHWKTSR